MIQHRLEPGAVVRVRDDRWRVLHVASFGECAVAELAGDGDANRGTTARFVVPFDVVEASPPPSQAPRRVRPVVFRAAARSVLAEATAAWTDLRAAASARITLLAYQLEPAIAMVRGLSCRLLLADAVGLGKTIQAGLLIAELIARDRDARILVVTPAGLREQWREELRERFRIDAEVIDASSLARATALLPAGINPWAVPRVILTSIDFVKRPDVIRALEPIVWDLVAFDEAHGLSGRSDRAMAAELLARRGRRVVAITATPHSGDSAAYARLLALGQLPGDNPMLVFRRSREQAGLAHRRVTRLLRVRATADERVLHRALEDYARRVFREAPRDSASAARLAMIVLSRRAASSASSLARSIERRMALLAGPETDNAFQLALPLGDGTLCDDEEPDAELAARGLPDSALEMRWLQRILGLARAAAVHESKIGAILRMLRRAHEPAIVFTEYRDTLDHVARVVAGREGSHEGLATLHGGMTAAEREREARCFTHGKASILLATDAASEGLNLQRRCRLVINLEMPWTPLRLEQRIGRVDRLGQERRVHAIGLLGRDTAEEAVIAALMNRAATAEREAPFGGANLRTDAETEGSRLATVRALDASPGPRVHVSGRRHERPVVALLSKRSRHVYAAVRLAFVDGSGFELWDTIVGARVLLADPMNFAIAVRVVENANALCGERIAELHDALRVRLRHDLHAAIEPLIAREQAILRVLRHRQGRLAAPLVQPGLFDRRALRDAEAQQRLADEAAAAAAERIAALQALLNPAVGAHRLVFAVIVP